MGRGDDEKPPTVYLIHDTTWTRGYNNNNNNNIYLLYQEVLIHEWKVDFISWS